MFEIIKEAVKYYNNIKRDEAMKKRLLKKNLDYEYLQKIVNEVESHNVVIVVNTADHAKIEIKPMKKERQNVVFTGD